MNWDAYFRVSTLMFLELPMSGAWMPVLALRLLGPMKLNGKQTGWIYATFPLASIFSPLLSGYLADKYVNAEHIILVSHAAGAILMFVAAKQTKFWGMFWTMFAYSIFYTATLPLIATVLYGNKDIAGWDAWVWLWAPVSWALVGYFLTGWRHVRKVGGDGPDSLYLTAFLSLVMVVVCLVQIPTVPTAKENPLIEALGMFRNTNYLVFIVLQLAVIGMQQFYFLGTGQFLQDKGVKGTNVSAIMALAQATQAAATILLLDRLIQWPGKHGYGALTGFQWTFLVGALCWSVLFAMYILLNRHTVALAIVQAFHGLAYVFFVIGGRKFVGTMAPDAIALRLCRCCPSPPTASGCSSARNWPASSCNGTASEASSNGPRFGPCRWSSRWRGPSFWPWHSGRPSPRNSKISSCGASRPPRPWTPAVDCRQVKSR